MVIHKTLGWLSLALLVGATVAWGAERIAVEEALADDAELHALAAVDRDHAWAVGDRGVIWATTTGGAEWRRQPSGVSCPLYGVWFLDPHFGWAVGGVSKPYLHHTAGVVLATTDGGLTWKQLSTPTLPLLRGVKFFDHERGVAFGAGSPFQPTGLFVTDDGGRGWRMIPSDRPASWTAGDFVDLEQGLCARGELCASLERRQLRRRPLAEAADLRAVRYSGAEAWAAGAGGMLLYSTTRGAAWRDALGLTPEDPARGLTFQALATQGDQVWAAGAPGTVVAHRANRGGAWEVLLTGHVAPLRALSFVDAQFGWAVGSLGAILATADGGATWRPQRAAARHAAVCVVCESLASAPLEYVARAALADGYRTVVLLAGAPAPEELDRLREAALACGAATVESVTTADLPVTLALWKPALVAVAPNSARSNLPAETLSAIELASGKTGREKLLALGLAPAEPKRVVSLLPDSTGGWNASDFAAAMGASPAQIAEPFHGWLHAERGTQAHKWRVTVLKGEPLPAHFRGDLLSDGLLAFDSPSRRPLTNSTDAKLGALRRLVQQRKHLQAILQRTTTGEEWANQVLTLTAGLTADEGAPLLAELADSYRARGQFDAMAETWYLLARRYADHPLCEATIFHLIRYYASAEFAEFAHRQAKPPHQASLANVEPAEPITAGVLPTTAVELGAAKSVLSRTERYRRAQLLGQHLEQARPTLFADPRVRFALSACSEIAPEKPAADLANRLLSEDWRRAALAERWIAKPNRAINKPLATSRVAAERPHLDGVIDDPCWVAATAVLFPTDDGGEVAPLSVRFAHDAEHLYLAIDAPQSPQLNYVAYDQSRERDEDLSQHDRVTVRLDLDRDYGVAYELTVDSRGCTRDTLAGASQWNPRWFVASALTKNRWRVEAAIPWREIAAEPPAAGAVWALGLERALPNGEVSRWTRAREAASPDARGLVRWE